MPEKKTKYSYTLYKHDIHHIMGYEFVDWRQNFFQEINNYLYNQGMDIKIKKLKFFTATLNGQGDKQIRMLDSLAIIQNDSTEEFYVLDCNDSVLTDEIHFLVQDERCKIILKCQFHRETVSDPIYKKIHPWTYFDRFWPTKEEELITARQNEPQSNILFFKGSAWGPRGPIMDELAKKGIITQDIRSVNFKDYITQTSMHRVLLSLPGMGDICHRDIEGFAVGTCVLRTRLLLEFHHNLIPDYHYISIDSDFWKTDPKALADIMEEKLTNALETKGYLESMARNAMDWYDTNVSYRGVMKLTKDLLQIN